MIIHNDKQRAEFIEKLNHVNLTVGPWIVEAKQYKPKRSAQINKLYHVWLRDIAKKTHYPIDEVTNYCKFTFGCPILISVSDEFEALYGDLISNLVYEQALKSMQFIAVTRLFNNKQMTEYMRGVESYAMQNDVQLTSPDFELWK